MSVVVRLDDDSIRIIRSYDKNLNKGVLLMKAEIKSLNSMIELQRNTIEDLQTTIQDHLTGNPQEVYQ